jgi:lauroyl/myristoyl acyltransferase
MPARKKSPAVFRLLDLILLVVLNLVRFMSRILPPQAMLTAADWVGYALYHAMKTARQQVLEDMREALPEISDQRELERIAKKAFGAPIKSMLDVILMESHLDTVMERFTYNREAIAVYDREKEAGRGAIALSPHIGGVGISFSLACRIGRNLSPVVLNPQNTFVPRFLGAMAGLSQKLGCDPDYPVFWAGEDTVNRVSEHVRQGRFACITFDLAGGTVAEFFGRPTAIASGIAHIACNTGAVILPGFIRRNQRPLEYEYVAYPDFSYSLTGDREADVKRVLQQIIECGEMMIRQCPEQWIGWLGLRGWRRRAEKILQQESGQRAGKGENPG